MRDHVAVLITVKSKSKTKTAIYDNDHTIKTDFMEERSNQKKKNIIVCIAEGSEEIEVVSVIDVVRRAEIDVLVAKVQPDNSSSHLDTSLQIVARSGTKLIADEHFATLYKRGIPTLLDQFDMVVLPGGLKGAQAFAACSDLVNLLQQFKQKRLFAAICASPAVVLAPHNLLDGIGRATCFPNMHDKLPEHVDIQSKNERVVEDANLITSQGPGTAIEFAPKIVERLVGPEKAKEVAGALLVHC